MASPDSGTRSDHVLLCKEFRRFGLTGGHSSFRTLWRVDDCVNVIGSNVRGDEGPSPFGRDIPDGLEDDGSVLWWDEIPLVRELLRLVAVEALVGGDQTGSGDVVIPVDGTALVAMQVASEGGEGEKVGHLD